MRKRAVMLVVVVALSGGACGGGDDGDADLGDATAPLTSEAPPAVPTTPTTDPAVAGRAKSAVLQQSDFPAGWQPLPESESGLGIDAVWWDLSRCLGIENAVPAAGEATSPTFKRDLATQAQSTVSFTDESSAGAIATALAGPQFAGCAQTVFTEDAKRNAPEGGVPGPVAVAPLDVASAAATKTSAYRITFTVDMTDFSVPITQDLLVVFDQGAVIRMLFLNPGSPFPQNLQRQLVEKVVSRA